jgi:hypothetical protein
MNWADERWVKVYTRDTADWLAFRWEAKALFSLLLRKADRAGVVQVVPGEARCRKVAGLVGLPADIVEPGIADLLADGCLIESELGFTFRNFIEAQDAPKSDVQRQRESREKRRALGSHEGYKPTQSVTKRDRMMSQNVTERHAVSHAVTDGHTVSHGVTPRVDESRREIEACVLLQEIWNDLRTPQMPRWDKSGKNRSRLAEAALKRRPIDQWREAMRRLAADPFFSGGPSGTGWVADPEYWLRPEGRKREPAEVLLERAEVVDHHKHLKSLVAGQDLYGGVHPKGDRK